ncbi:uncharacterized protein LOC141649100 [Silene latifolia]|uniref:uncharacterized protein LOC141649100 n=1 Tax=Silene latifolia TaxID=37657 RepID=UPI003D784DFB
MKVASWNIRGFNCPLKHSEVRDYLGVNKIDILALLETRVKEHNASKIIRKKFRNWNVVCNYSHHYNGRIWVFFNPSTITMLSKTVADQLIHFKVHHHESCSTFHLSTVYGCNDPLDRHRLWSSFAAVATSEPWLVLGDFNVVRSPSEKLSNTPPVLQDMLDFNDCLASCHLDDLTCTGVDMTWTNKQDSVTRVWSKLDRVLANPGFITSYPNAFGHFQEPGLSDHSPILVQISQDKKVVKRFSFLNSWVAHPDYLQTIKAAWITPLQGSPMYCFFQKLKSVKHALTQFHKQHFSNISHRVQSAKNALMECQQKLASNPFSDVLIQEERLLIGDYTKLKDHEFSIFLRGLK